jgi:LuxR family transcriptional regulator, maltose regulon positive regulatory protein
MTTLSTAGQGSTPRSACQGGPALPRLIDRHALVASLDRAAERRVTIITAPAGSGKTSLLRSWADRPGRSHRTAFVPVRRDQQDAQLFWLALLGAVRSTSGKTSGANSAGRSCW